MYMYLINNLTVFEENDQIKMCPQVIPQLYYYLK